MSLMSLLVAVVVVGLIWWAANALMRAFGIGDPIATVVRVVLVIGIIVWLVGAVFGLGPGIRVHW